MPNKLFTVWYKLVLDKLSVEITTLFLLNLCMHSDSLDLLSLPLPLANPGFAFYLGLLRVGLENPTKHHLF